VERINNAGKQPGSGQEASMRATLIALLIAAPIASFAQTPRDIQNLVQPNAVSASISQTPASVSDFAGSASARDVAAQISSNLVPASISQPARPETLIASGFGAADLARMANVPSAPTSTGGIANFLTASFERSAN
jgi:hypothetical protein